MSRFAPFEEPQPIHLHIAEALRRAIRRGELRVGERLPLEEIAKEFGVSRMPVREALIRLEREHLVVFHNRRGAQVAGISKSQIEEITHLRSLLETDALREASGKYQRADFDELREILRQAKHEKDLDVLADLHWRFHHCLYAPCDRPIELEMIDTLHANVDRFFRLEWRSAGLRQNWIDEHEQIVAALERNDISMAVEMIGQHMRAAANRVSSFLEKS